MCLLFETPDLFKSGDLCTSWPAGLTLKNQAREGMGGMGGWRFYREAVLRESQECEAVELDK